MTRVVRKSRFALISAFALAGIVLPLPGTHSARDAAAQEADQQAAAEDTAALEDSSQEAPAPPPDRWRSRIEVGFNGATGNKTFAILRSAFSIKHLLTDVAEFEWASSYRYGKSEGDVVANELKTSLKADLHPEDTWSPFVFADAVRDPTRRIDVRASGGAGAKYTFTHSDRGEGSLSNALLFEHENFDKGADQELDSEWHLRWSFRLRGERRLGESARVEHVSLYQPVFDEFGDYLMDVKTGLSSPVFGGVDLVLEHEYLRNSTPPPGVERDDQRLSVLFRLQM